MVKCIFFSARLYSLIDSPEVGVFWLIVPLNFDDKQRVVDKVEVLQENSVILNNFLYFIPQRIFDKDLFLHLHEINILQGYFLQLVCRVIFINLAIILAAFQVVCPDYLLFRTA